MLFATTGYVLLPSSVVWANPAGEQVVGGAATFQRDGNTLTVNQTTDRLAVNWQSFNIAAGEHTHFNMPSAASIALNRVLGGNPSDIRGTLTGNGTIIVANQFGISTAPGSVIKTGSLILTTKDINPEQFMHADPGQGIHLYGDSTATIVNQGNLTAEKGDVFLIAQKVENRGTISAPNGKAALVGAGGGQDKTDVVLYEKEGSGFAVRVTQLMGEAAAGSNRGLPDGEELLNEGEIAAAQAELNASGNIYALAIRNSGTIRAKAVVANADGTVRLDGGLGDVRNTGTLIAKNAGAEANAAGGKIEVTGQNVTASPESIITAAGGEQGGNGGKVKIDSAGTTIVQGKVDVSAPAAGAKGGKAEILGERVGLFEGAKVDASGGAGGGTVLVGGDYLGGRAPAESLRGLVELEDEAVKNAKATVMAESSEIKADATVNGNGGKVIIWSDEYTGFYGKIFARGGSEGGNGGFVETSSFRNLQSFGQVDASAPKGFSGHWLLDPYDIVIGSTNSGISPATPFVANGASDPAQVNATTIEAALNGGTSVTVKTVSGGGTNATGTGAISVNSNITKTNGAAATLTLESISSISGSGAITASGVAANSLSVVMQSVSGNSYSGVIETRGGNVTINNSGTGAINLAGGFIDTGAGFAGNISINQSGTQNIILQGLTSGGTVSVTSQGGNISLNNANYRLTGASATFNANGGNVNLDGGGNFANTTAALSLRGNAGITIDGDLSTAGLGADINLNSDNGNISISGGGSVVGNNNVNIAAGQNIRLSGNVDSFGGAPGGTLSLRAGGAIQNIDAIGVLNPDATTVTFIEAAAGIRFNFGRDAIFQAQSTGGGDIRIEDASPLAGSDFTIGGDGIRNGGAVTIRAGLLTGTLTLAAGFVPMVNSASFQAQAGGGIFFGGPTTELFPIVRTTGLQQYDSPVTLAAPVAPAVASENWLAAGQILFNAVNATAAGSGSLGLAGTPDVTLNGLIGGLNALQNFTIRGGSITFGVFTTRGNPTLPPPLDTPVGPAINLVGTASFDSTRLILQNSTWLRAQNDLIFGGAVTGFRDGEFPVFQVDSTDGNIFFLQDVGNTAIPLGQVDVIAGVVDATDPDTGLPTAGTGGGQIGIIGNITTLPGETPIVPGGTGNVRLQTFSETKGIVILGNINTAGGPNYQDGALGGAVELLTPNATFPGANIQLEGNILTRGGAISLLGPVFIAGNSSLDNTQAANTGAITFGEPGQAHDIFLEGDLLLSSGGAVQINGDINGSGTFDVLVQNGNTLTINGSVGNTSPLGSFIVRTGSGDLTLGNDIFTGGGQVSFGMRVRLSDNVSIDTTRLNNANGGRVEFLQGVIGAESGRVYVNNEPQFIPYVAGQPYLITRLVGTEPGDVPTNFASIGAVPVAATGLQIGQEYIITASGNTNFTEFGATSNAVGTVFTATKSGSALDGTGTTLLTYFTATGAGAGSGTANQLNDLVVNGGITGVVGFGASAQAPEYSGRINSLTVLNAGSFSVTSALEAFGENGNGNALEFLPSFNSTLAGSVNILKSVGSGNILLRNGINTSFLAAKAGSVTLQSVGTGEVIIQGSVAMNGGSNLLGTIGFDGGDLIVNSKSNFIMPTSISNTGGDGTFTDGKAGKVTIDTTIGNGNISFSSGIFDVIQDSQYTLAAGGSVILGILADPNANLFSSDPADLRISGTVLQLNRTAQGTDFSLASRGSFNVGYGGSLEANQADAYFYVPSESAILTFGGALGIVRLHNSPAASYSPTRREGGLPQLGGVNLNGQTVTTVEGLASGNVSINQNGLKQAITGNSLAVVESGVVLTGAITTRGGTPPQETIVGLKGGDVRITGTSVFLNGIINTSGSNSLDGGENAIGIGGVGGTVDITGTTGITIGRDIITSGGSGISQLSGTGGPGGAITLGGSVLLDSRSGDVTTIVLDTQGGLGLKIGDEGAGGNIRAIGSITGTEANSNTLDLRYGSGQVTLGSDASDVISLGELITAADDARSTGLLQVRAFMDSITTLTTYARGYNISLSGGGTVVNQTTFLNTGFVQIGNRTPGLAFDTTTTFAGGINTQTGPSATVLAGQLQTSNEFLDTEASILLGAVELGRNSFLNTFGNTLALGSVDSITDSFDLTLLAGIGNGTIQLPGNIGAKAGQLSVLGNGTFLAAPGIITIQDMPLRIDPIVFAGTVNAEAISSISSIPFEFRQDVNFSGISDIAGNVTLNNVAGGINVLDFNMGAGSEIGGNLTLQGGAASLGGDGNWAVAGAVSGGQNLTIQGSGIKTFGGLIGTQATPLGGPTGPSIRILADRVEFSQPIQTRFGINSEIGTTAAFLAGANVTTRGSSQFLGTVELSGMSFNAGGATRFTGLNLEGGTVTLAGTGTYNTTGPVSGNGFNLILGGTSSSSKVFAGGLADLGLLSLLSASGASTFGGFVQADNILQAAGAGRANFAGNVEIRTGTLSSFAAGVLLGDGITFTASAGTTTFLATSTPRLGGNVTLAGAGDIAFDAALRGDTAIIGNTAVLTLGDSGQRTFGNTVAAGSLVQEAGAGLLSANQTITLADGLGTSRLRNAALTGMTLAAAGTVEILGTVTANGNTTISGGALPEAIVLGAGNNLVANTTGATFTLKGGVRMEADAVLDGVGNYAFANNINGASYLLTLGAGGTKAFQGQLSLDRIVQVDGSNTATFAGGVELVGDGILLGNVVLSGANQTFRSLGGSLQFGNAGSDLLTISKASVLVSDAATSVTVASQIRLAAQLGIQTGSVFLGQIAGSSSNLSLDVNDVNLGGTVALGSGTMTMRSLDPLAISLGDNPLGLNLDKTELGLISTSGGLRIEDNSGSGISVDNVASTDVAGITGPVRLLSTGGVVAFMSPSTLPKLGVAAQDVSGLNNATFQEIAQLELVNPAADININAGGSMAISGPVAIGNGKNFNLTANGDVVIGSRVSSGGGVLINPQGGYFVNQSGGQVFDNATLNSVNGVRVVTRDLFTPGLATAFVPGLQVVFGVSDPALLGRNQIGSTANFTDGNFAPYYFEFATGSAQPYIFAQQTSVPLVQFAPALNFAGGLPTPPRYTAEEIEMLTPEERSAYEARQREQSARVILQSSAGQEELGANPSAPQASRVPDSRAPKTPTAQVWLQGKPMARSGSDSDRHDTTRLLRPKGTRAVALRDAEMNTELLLAERISAEIGISAKPIASQR